MIVGEVDKQPAETFLVGVNFSPTLGSAETITGQTVTAKRVSDGADASLVVLTGGAVLAGTTVAHRVAAGADGERYVIQYRVSTSDANIWEDEVLLKVKEH